MRPDWYLFMLFTVSDLVSIAIGWIAAYYHYVVL